MLRNGPGWIILSLALLTATPAAAEPFRYPEGKHGDSARLRYVNGVPVLEVGGKPEQIGAAVGKLALKPAPKVLGYPRGLVKLFKADNLWNLLVAGGHGMYRQFPATV